jgi:hypothetical protein
VVLVDGVVDGTLEVDVELGTLLVLDVELAEDELVVLDGVLDDAPPAVDLLDEELGDAASVVLVLEDGILDELDDSEAEELLEVDVDVPDVVETVV